MVVPARKIEKNLKVITDSEFNMEILYGNAYITCKSTLTKIIDADIYNVVKNNYGNILYLTRETNYGTKYSISFLWNRKPNAILPNNIHIIKDLRELLDYYFGIELPEALYVILNEDADNLMKDLDINVDFIPEE